MIYFFRQFLPVTLNTFINVSLHCIYSFFDCFVVEKQWKPASENEIINFKNTQGKIDYVNLLYFLFKNL